MHTRGPWAVHSDERGTCIDTAYDHPQLCGPVPIVTLSTGLNGPQIGIPNRDDANIIAASPAMYEAIKEYLEWGPKTNSDRDYLERKFREAIEGIE